MDNEFFAQEMGKLIQDYVDDRCNEVFRESFPPNYGSSYPIYDDDEDGRTLLSTYIDLKKAGGFPESFFEEFLKHPIFSPFMSKDHLSKNVVLLYAELEELHNYIRRESCRVNMSRSEK